MIVKENYIKNEKVILSVVLEHLTSCIDDLDL